MADSKKAEPAIYNLHVARWIVNDSVCLVAALLCFCRDLSGKSSKQVLETNQFGVAVLGNNNVFLHLPGGRCSLNKNFSLFVKEPLYKVSVRGATYNNSRGIVRLHTELYEI